MAANALDDQEAAQVRPPLMSARVPAPQVVLVVVQPATVRSVAPPELLPSALDVIHAGFPVQLVEGPAEEALRPKEQAATYQEVANRLKLAVETGQGPVDVPVAAAADPVAVLLAASTGLAVPVRRRAPPPAAAVPTSGQVPVVEPQRLGLVV